MARAEALLVGHVILYVGQLVAAIDVGAPARIEWDPP
jgi:hypothetical protein